MPNFGHYNVTDRLAWQLLALIHDDFLWIQDKFPIDVALIHRITGLPMQGPHPMENVGKKYEGETATQVCEAYHVKKNKRDFIIESISDSATWMGTQILAWKLMRKCQVAMVPAYVIRVVGQCAKGVCFN